MLSKHLFSSKDPRLRCVKQKSLDLLTNVSTIPDIARLILDHHSSFIIQLIQGIRDGHLIEEKIPSSSVLLRLCKVIVEKNLLICYQHLIDMQFIDILIDIFENEQYKTNDTIIYFIKFESFALQCIHIMLECAEHIDMWSEKAQIRLVNYCCTLLYKSVLEEDDDQKHHQRLREIKINHIIYAEEHGIIHSLASGILIFLSVVRCRKEIGKFYRENEHFRELLNIMKQKYNKRNEFLSRDPSISYALEQILNNMFDQKKRRYYHRSPIKDNSHNQIKDNNENHLYRKCSNSLCQMIENNKIQFENCPHCHTMSYCSQYCREVHWTLNHNLSCLPMNSNRKTEESTVLCMIDRFSDQLSSSSSDYHNNKTASVCYKSAFETLPVQLPQTIIETTTDEITNDLCYPSLSPIEKKKSLKTFLALLRINKKRK
ncbi:unnamed protein product [Adineta steineri]|uniref:MYND-type domain-containing protein n=1 Tax=Adineta steineri TaxID=433720 RepID=A0A814SLZ8_9BILA|nr:unnamed protein product [Adineta steineri]